uniref:WD_REPEATS_REGION domain-containing protein n=1 Tax=Caenorhabditis tropicalis TaxID=1561998 RepID=A0A1I7TAB2_9PELO
MWSSTTSSHQNQQKIHEKVYKNEHQVCLPPCELKREEYEPKKSFYEMHQQTKRWTNWESQRIVTAPGHCATVDSVLLFEKNDNKFCLSESRDRVIRFWDVDNVERGVDSVANPWTVAQDDMAQLEWSWNMARDSNTDRFYSTSWDSTVKSWAITDNGAIQNLNTVNVGSAVQAVSCSGNENEIVCTTFAKRTAVIDSRTFGIVAEHSLHKRAVIGLAVKENKIFTCGEDRLMMMVDRRNMSRPVLFEYCQDAYKSSLSLQRNQLLTSTSDGKVKLYDATNFHDFQTYSVGAFTRQSLLQHGAHFVMARCKRGYYKFLMNSPGIRSPKRCSSHQLTAKPAKFDYSSEMKTLTIGNSMDRSERRSMIVKK